MRAFTPYPLPLSQQQVWLDQQSHPNSGHLSIGGMGFINDPLNLAIFGQALQQMFAQNESLQLYH
jgi:hypothetical protein